MVPVPLFFNALVQASKLPMRAKILSQQEAPSFFHGGISLPDIPDASYLSMTDRRFIRIKLPAIDPIIVTHDARVTTTLSQEEVPLFFLEASHHPILQMLRTRTKANPWIRYLLSIKQAFDFLLAHKSRFDNMNAGLFCHAEVRSILTPNACDDPFSAANPIIFHGGVSLPDTPDASYLSMTDRRFILKIKPPLDLIFAIH